MDRVIRVILDPSGVTQGGNVIRRELGSVDQAIENAASSQDGFTSSGRDGFRELLPEVEGVSDTFSDLTRGADQLETVTEATTDITDGFDAASVATRGLKAANDDTAIGLANTADSLSDAADSAADFVSSTDEFQDIRDRMAALSEQADNLGSELPNAANDSTSSVSRLKRAFSGLGRGALIVGGIAVALGALAVAVVATSEKSRDLFSELGIDLIDLGKTTLAAVRDLLGPVGDFVNDTLRVVSGTVNNVTDAIAEFAGIERVNTRLERFNKGLAEGRKLGDELATALIDSQLDIEESLVRTTQALGLTNGELLVFNTRAQLADDIIALQEDYAQAIEDTKEAIEANNIEQNEGRGIIEGLKRELADASDTYRGNALAVLRQAEATGEAIDTQERMTQALATFNSLLSDQSVFDQQIEDLILLRDTIGPTQISIEEFAEAVLEAQKGLNLDDITEDFSELQQIANAGAQDLQNTFADFLFDPIETGFDGLVRGFADALRRMAAEALASSIFTALFGVNPTSGGTGNGLGSFIGGLFGRMHGGGVRGGQTVLTGENGPELFTPQSAGTIIPNLQTSGFGASMIQAPQAPPNITLINTIDKSEITGAFQGGAGDRVLMNRFSTRQNAFRRALGIN